MKLQSIPSTSATLPSYDTEGLTVSWREFVELSKPGILASNVLMTALGLWIAPARTQWGLWVATMLGTSLAVGAANALNMYLERDIDARMRRTRQRPLPSGRLTPGAALSFGLSSAVLSVLILAAFVNGLVALLSALAIVSYVMVYTPLKQTTPHALFVGAVAGALPPLIGWSAATGRLGVGGLIVFALMFLWQIPHFIAISIYQTDDYRRGGICTLPLIKGDKVAKTWALYSTILLTPTSLLLPLCQVSSVVFVPFGIIAGFMFLASARRNLTDQAGKAGARRFFSRH